MGVIQSITPYLHAVEGSQSMKPHIELALERWAEEYNEQWEKRNDWHKWLRDNQHIPSAKALLDKSEVNDAKT